MQFFFLPYTLLLLCLLKYKLLFSLSFSSHEENSKIEEFCTALPLPSLPSVAQCRPQQENSVEYQIETLVPSGRDSFCQCEIQLTLVGKNAESQPIVISSTEGGTRRRQKVALDDLGPITQVKVMFIGTSSLPWTCRKITVYEAFFWWSFDCIGTLDSRHNVAIYSLSGNKIYTLTVRTGSDVLAETHGSILVNIKGDASRETGNKFIGDAFLASSQKVITLRATDVGNVNEVLITNLAEDDPWYCISMDIRGDDGNTVHLPVRRWIGKPYEESVSIGLGHQHLMETPAQDIECFTRANDIISGLPEEPHITKVRCPMYCHTNPFALVRGSSIHPASSSICQSGILDGVLSPSGGELIVTVVGSLPNYFEATEAITKIVSRDYEPSPDSPTFSFFLFQSYSIDNIEKDVRLVDAYGRLSSVGRLEFRRKGVWGTVCSKGDTGTFTQAAARQACMDMGFLHGVYLEEGCSSVNGVNICSAKGYPTVAAAVQCTGNEKNIANCTFEEPPTFCNDHIYDVVVQCTNLPLDREPLPGTIRLVDASNSPSLSGIGRLEYYLDGWGTICDDGFTSVSAVVACREMGYTGTKSGSIFKKGCKDVYGENLCAQPATKINVINLSCDGSEKNVRNCPHESHSDIYCVHDEDIVIGCEGNGDPSGVGVYKKPELPDVSLRPFPPMLHLSCSDRPINTKSLKALPGAMFIVRCPGGCSEDTTGYNFEFMLRFTMFRKSDVRGTYIYTDDSSVCRAAIHTGVITDTGGDLIVILGYGQKNYIGNMKIKHLDNLILCGCFDSLRFHIQSSSYGPYGRSFMVSRLTPYVKSQVVPETKKNIYLHFSGESTLSGKTQTSFLQSSNSDNKDTLFKGPIFTWCPSPDFSGFHYGLRNFVDASKLSGGSVMKDVSDFTISVLFRVTGRSGTWRTLLAHTECHGFTLAIDNLDNIVFEQICNPKTISTGFKPEMNKLYHVLVTFLKGGGQYSTRYYKDGQLSSEKNLSLFVNGRLVSYEKTDFVFNFKSPLTIGRSSYLDVEYFEGDIECIRIFGFVMSPSQVEEENKEIQIPSNVCPKTLMFSREGSINRFTVDGRICLTDCLPLPESLMDTSKFDILGRTSTVIHPSIAISCDTSLDNEHFNGATGEIFRVRCPKNCCKATTPVYGSEFYAGKSSICRAALHRGIMPTNGEEIFVTLQNGLLMYEGSAGHNYVISESETTPQPRSFSVSRASEPMSFSCTQDGSFIMKMPLDARQLIKCPSGCQNNQEINVFGSGNRYSPSSSVCRAAIHAGVLTDTGGQVELKVSGDTHFDGSVQNNVVSRPSNYYLSGTNMYVWQNSLNTPLNYDRVFQVSSGLYRAILSNWKFYPSSYSVPIRFELTKEIPHVVMKSTVGLVVRDVHIDPKESPGHFVLKNFGCDEYTLYTSLILSDIPTIAGLSFDVEKNGDSLFTLTAHVKNANGMGEWILKKIVNGNHIFIGKPVAFTFKIWKPIYIYLEAKAGSFTGWAIDDQDQKQMIAHVKNVQWNSMSENPPGSVGIHIYEAPSTGVFWTEFELSVSSDNQFNTTNPNISQNVTGLQLFSRLERISRKNIFPRVF